jgi:ABC-type Na+ efflux pump permease subunit/membrane protease YdiL (CAAX protease family)
LAQKELRETLRDRRTVVTLILMPLLVYPILSLIFRTFLVTGAVGLASSDPIKFRIAVQSDGTDQECLRILSEMRRDAKRLEEAEAALIAPYRKSTPPIQDFDKHDVTLRHDWENTDVVQSSVQQGRADVGLILELHPEPEGTQGAVRSTRPIRAAIVANANSLFATKAADYLRDYLEAINRLRLEERGALSAVDLLVETRRIDVATAPRSAISFGTLIPLILVLMTITGAVYPAIDLTAGERERGTMEALVAAPIPRMQILFAKFVAVLSVAMLTATLNLIGMLVTIWAFQLEGLVFQSGRISALAIAQVFALLLLYAAFFSAVLLAVTSFARSFKEAQAYLIPLILLSLAPGVVSLAPGLYLSGVVCLVPLLNFVLLARDILQGQFAFAPAVVAILSTLLYAILAIAVASRIFGTDAILYGSHETVKDSLRRPTAPQLVASRLTAIFCLTCLFPANFLAISILGRLASADGSLPVELSLLIVATTTIAFFIGVPLLFAWHQRIRLSSGFALRRPDWVPWLAAIVVGLTLWPISILIITATQQLIALVGGVESSLAWQNRLIEGGQAYVERWRQLPFWAVLATHALIPAIAEEWFFRGFLLQALLPRAKSAAGPILLSGAVFGAFHLLTESVIAVDRLVPTTLMGIVLAYVCWRTGSIVPGIFLHALNNGTVIALVYYQDALQRLSWFPFQGDRLPIAWIGSLLLIAAVGLAAIGVGGWDRSAAGSS